MCVRCTKCHGKIEREDLGRDFYMGGVAHLSCPDAVAAYKELQQRRDRRSARIRRRIPTRVRKPIGTRLGR